MAVTGVIAFIQPFSIEIIGLHALTGFLFIGVVAGHIFNNSVALKKYIKSPPLSLQPPYFFMINLPRLKRYLALVVTWVLPLTFLKWMRKE